MIKTLTPYGNGAALIIDEALLKTLGIDMDTPLEVVTDGDKLIISPVRDGAKKDRIGEALGKVNARHSETLKKLAE